MSLFRKKPIVIEAVQFHLAEYADNPFNELDELPDWFAEAARQKVVNPEFKSEDYWYLKISTLEGDMYASPGDWVIQGVNGEIYPCKPDIFEKTYEAVSDDLAEALHQP